MKSKIVYLIIALLFNISKVYGCEIKEVIPNTISAGDSTTLMISLSHGCGQVSEVKIYSYRYHDSINSILLSQINDSTVSAKFYIPETVNIGPAAIGIESYFNDEYDFYQSEQGIIDIGTSLVQKPAICMVSVDSTNNNIIIWENTDNSLIDSVFIYKEVSKTNNFLKIGARSTDDANYYIDTESLPGQNSNSYKISFIDTSGYESPLSNYHKTIHLTMSLGINGACNLIWDEYEGFSYSTFNVFKGSSVVEMRRIAELPTNLFSYTDLAPSLGENHYCIEVSSPKNCSINGLKSAGTDYISTRSNIVNLKTTSSREENELNGIVCIKPNPAINDLYISVKSDSDLFKLSIYSAHGRLLVTKWINNNFKEDISKLASGLYLIKIEYDNKIIIDKILKK